MTPLRRRPAWTERWNQVRPTAAGVWFLVVLVGVTIAALNTGNNPLYLVLAALLALLVLNNLLAETNLRGLRVERRLPPELHAGVPAEGRLRLVNPRRWGTAWDVEVAELDGSGASARFARVPAGDAGEQPAAWCFPARGTRPLGDLSVGSSWPFGLLRRWRELPLPGEVLVYPAREPEPPPLVGEGQGTGLPARSGVEATGELVGLRAYAPGDPTRRIHAATSARVGAPMVVLRGDETGGEVTVDLRPARGEAWERAIRKATGKVLDHARRGDAVGLRVDGETVPPALGEAHRRRLLACLATLPAREG